MTLGRVSGEVVATIQHAAYANRRALLVDRIDADGRELGAYVVAIDTVGAGVGQTVLILDEGNSARQVIGDPNAPVRTIVVGIVDEIASS